MAVVRLLLDSGASLNERSPFGLTPLQTALRLGFDEISRVLLRSGAKLMGGEAVDAIRGENGELLDYLLEHGTAIGDKRPDGWSPLDAAFLTGNNQLIKTVLDLQPHEYHPVEVCAAVCGIARKKESIDRTGTLQLFNR